MTTPNEEEAKENKCTFCDHTFHAGRCFSTTTVGRHYAQCTCKKGVR